MGRQSTGHLQPAQHGGHGQPGERDTSIWGALRSRHSSQGHHRPSPVLEGDRRTDDP